MYTLVVHMILSYIIFSGCVCMYHTSPTCDMDKIFSAQNSLKSPNIHQHYIKPKYISFSVLILKRRGDITGSNLSWMAIVTVLGERARGRHWSWPKLRIQHTESANGIFRCGTQSHVPLRTTAMWSAYIFKSNIQSTGWFAIQCGNIQQLTIEKKNQHSKAITPLCRHCYCAREELPGDHFQY